MQAVAFQKILNIAQKKSLFTTELKILITYCSNHAV